MHAQIVSFRRSRHRQYDNQMILAVQDITSKEAASALVGKQVAWESTGKEKKKITGTITACHGTKGRVRALFERGLPGQSIGNTIPVS
ncbi:MAG TPA: 50S ribosomal protein L35ae [Candidatus Nanoarchaeia archaeon]|nr:50S ribosomal protein L35ae [Candidatus Nanoarchaeia archaeon]